jgi:GNAT superfamily N-acetyltransferase
MAAMTSHWSACYKERFDWETIELEGGFIAYKLNPPDASIEEFYVRPDLRGGPLAFRLANQVKKIAQEKGAKSLWAKVEMGRPHTEKTLGMNMKYGFKIAGVSGNELLLHMDIGG